MGYTGKLQFRLPCSASISNASPSMQDLHMTFFQNLHCFDHPWLWRARDKDNCVLGELHKGQTLPFSVTSSFNSWQQTQYVLRGLSRDFSQTCSLGCAFPSISCLNILCCIRALMSVAPGFLLGSAQSSFGREASCWLFTGSQAQPTSSHPPGQYCFEHLHVIKALAWFYL